MQLPLAFDFGSRPLPPANIDGVPTPTEPLNQATVCRICGMPITTMQDLQLVAHTPVHPVCVRQMQIMTWQLSNHLPMDNAV